MKIQPKKVDLLKLQLTSEQGFVLSRIDRPMTLAELAGLSGLPEVKLLLALEALAHEGAVDVDPPFPPRSEAPPPSARTRAHGASAKPPPAARPSAGMRVASPASTPPVHAPQPEPPPAQVVAAPPPSAPAPIPSFPTDDELLPEQPGEPASPPPPAARSAIPAARPSRPAIPVRPPPIARASSPGAGGPSPAPRPSAPIALGPAEVLDFNLEIPAPAPAPAPPSSKPSPAAKPASGEALVAPVAALGPSLVVYGVTDVGVVRTNNEDAFAVLDLAATDPVDVASEPTNIEASDRGVVVVVSDGMGGENAGEVASAMVIDGLREHFARGFDAEDPAGSLVAGLVHANAKVIDGAKEPGREGMGATVIAVHVGGSTAYTAEIGDSRAYLFRQGKLRQLSKDQTQVQLLLDQGLLTPETVKTSRAKNVVLQAIGKVSELVVAQRRIELRRGDRLLLCSDGLTGHVTDAEIAGFLWGDRLDEACREMVTLAKERGGKDNITIVLVELEGPAPPPGPGETVDQTLATLRAFELG